MAGPAAQALGPLRSSWAKLLFSCCTEHQVNAPVLSEELSCFAQDKLSLKKFCALVQYFGQPITEEGAAPQLLSFPLLLIH